MDLDPKFQEAIYTVKTAIMDLDLAKMTYKDKVKKGGGQKNLMQLIVASKSAPDKPKKLKKTEGKESPQAAVVAANAALDNTRNARNKAQD